MDATPDAPQAAPPEEPARADVPGPVPRDAQAPARREAVLAGPDLRDVEAAVACVCACHPRPAELTLHHGGATCPCQLSESETAELLATLLAHGGDDGATGGGRDEERMVAAARQLGVALREWGGMAPFVISGVVDGRGFYLRERHDVYRVVVAPDSDPDGDPWRGGAGVPETVVARGVYDDLCADGKWDPVRALELSVAAVRTFLLRRSCVHAVTENYCATCGVEISRAGV